MTRLSPTPQQKKLLDFLRTEMDRTGIAPSIREMCAGIGLHSIGSVHRMLNELDARGLIARARNRSRAIVIDAPATGSAACSPTAQQPDVAIHFGAHGEIEVRLGPKVGRLWLQSNAGLIAKAIERKAWRVDGGAARGSADTQAVAR